MRGAGAQTPELKKNNGYSRVPLDAIVVQSFKMFSAISQGVCFLRGIALFDNQWPTPESMSCPMRCRSGCIPNIKINYPVLDACSFRTRILTRGWSLGTVGNGLRKRGGTEKPASSHCACLQMNDHNTPVR